MVSGIITRHLIIRYPLSMISKPKKKDLILYTYSGYSFEKKKETKKPPIKVVLMFCCYRVFCYMLFCTAFKFIHCNFNTL